MIFPEDIQYERWLETGKVATIGEYSLEDWPYPEFSEISEDSGYEMNDPKHPTYHERYSDYSDTYDYDF